MDRPDRGKGERMGGAGGEMKWAGGMEDWDGGMGGREGVSLMGELSGGPRGC